jgi:Tfp pilus assembly protein PilN
MIKVNLVGTGRKKSAKAGMKMGLPASFTPILLILIVLGFAGGGYWWYSNLTGQVAELESKIKQAEAQKAALENVIKQDQVFEARKKALQNRVTVIEGLQKNQISPVIALDQLSEAVDRTQYVWLSSLDQSNAILSMSGTANSLNAVADFYTNLQATGYFKNIEISNAVDSSGNFSFSLRCEFSPPRIPAPATQAAAGGN